MASSYSNVIDHYLRILFDHFTHIKSNIVVYINNQRPVKLLARCITATRKILLGKLTFVIPTASVGV